MTRLIWLTPRATCGHFYQWAAFKGFPRKLSYDKVAFTHRMAGMLSFEIMNPTIHEQFLLQKCTCTVGLNKKYSPRLYQTNFAALSRVWKHFDVKLKQRSSPLVQYHDVKCSDFIAKRKYWSNNINKNRTETLWRSLFNTTFAYIVSRDQYWPYWPRGPDCQKWILNIRGMGIFDEHFWAQPKI